MISDPSVFPTVWLDGAFLPGPRARVSAVDRGLLVGDGVFETMHVLRGVPLALDGHLARLTRSASALGLDLPAGGLATVLAACRGVLSRNRLDGSASPEAALRVTLTSGQADTGPPTLTVHARRVSALQAERRLHGVPVHVFPQAAPQSALSQHKTTSRAFNAWVARWLRSRGADARAEGLLVTGRGEVLEGSWSNVFIVEPGGLVTPPVAAGLLPGTARARVLDLARTVAGWTSREEAVTLDRLMAADEVFLTASTLHVAPVVSVDGQTIADGRPGKRVQALQALYRASVEDEIRSGVDWTAGSVR